MSYGLELGLERCRCKYGLYRHSVFSHRSGARLRNEKFFLPNTSAVPLVLRVPHRRGRTQSYRSWCLNQRLVLEQSLSKSWCVKQAPGLSCTSMCHGTQRGAAVVSCSHHQHLPLHEQRKSSRRSIHILDLLLSRIVLHAFITKGRSVP